MVTYQEGTVKSAAKQRNVPSHTIVIVKGKITLSRIKLAWGRGEGGGQGDGMKDWEDINNLDNIIFNIITIAINYSHLEFSGCAPAKTWCYEAQPKECV
jgi:hypothetical protein